jgi:hypothetical protein
MATKDWKRVKAQTKHETEWVNKKSGDIVVVSHPYIDDKIYIWFAMDGKSYDTIEGNLKFNTKEEAFKLANSYMRTH